MRLQKPLDEGTLGRLNADFADILKAGVIRQAPALEAEADEPELAGLPRLVFRHRRRDFGRLRQFIDAVNASQGDGRDRPRA